MSELTEEDKAELAQHLFASEASRVMAAVLARCIRFTERCDEQMTARMQRKNRQVGVNVDRVSPSTCSISRTSSRRGATGGRAVIEVLVEGGAGTSGAWEDKSPTRMI